MNLLPFSKTAIVCLQNLVTQYYYFTGVRHRLSDEHGIMELLKRSAMTTHANVYNAYQAFVKRLDKSQLEMLIAQGIELSCQPAANRSLVHYK